MKNKMVLVLTDAIACRYKAGPGGSADSKAYKVIATQDPVANDYHVLQILKKLGLSSNRQSLAEKVLAKAADPSKYNTGATEAIGTNNPANMEVINISAPFGQVATTRPADMPHMGQLVSLSYKSSGPMLHYSVPRAGAQGLPVSVDLYTVRGRKAACVMNEIKPFGTYDFQLNSSALPSGKYIAAIQIGITKRTIPFYIL
jgi:hypothetical protein